MSAILTVQHLSYSYPDGKGALRDVSFVVQEGECLGVVGPNGAGKSTLLHHLNGLLPEDDPDSPRVFIRDTPLTRVSRFEFHRKVGLMFQDPDDQLFCASVYEDVAFGPVQAGVSGEELNALVARSLQSVGLEGCERRSPHHLSGGEKRRACLAGVLACDPEVLVLDEPSSNLDPRGKRELRALLQGLPITRIIATHDLELVVQICSRVIVLDQGRVVAEGETAGILGNEELMMQHGLEKPHILRHVHPH